MSTKISEIPQQKLNHRFNGLHGLKLADYIITGSYQKENEDLLLFTKILDVRSGNHIAFNDRTDIESLQQISYNIGRKSSYSILGDPDIIDYKIYPVKTTYISSISVLGLSIISHFLYKHYYSNYKNAYDLNDIEKNYSRANLFYNIRNIGFTITLPRAGIGYLFQQHNEEVESINKMEMKTFNQANVK